jgi:hypothetical protein
MSVARQAVPGATRTCPHCRTTILESASICPACRHRLRFDPGLESQPSPSFSALQIEGTIHHPPGHGVWEYSVVLSIRNERGEEVARQVVGVGALKDNDQRSFSLAVDVYTPEDGGDS